MQKIQLKTAAPMPASEIEIAKSSMKLYSYLVCIAGLANYPDNTRMFRQKDLVLTKIYQATGISDKTVKFYLYYLEYTGRITFKGQNQYSHVPLWEYEQKIENNNFISQLDPTGENPPTRPILRKEAEKEAFRVWSLRNKEEKNGVYWISRPSRWTPVPETTLETLNEKYQASELEMKLYLLCCSYRDTCVSLGQNYKDIRFETIRDAFNLTKQTANDKKIRESLMFLKVLDLIDFEESYYVNSKLAKIPCFRLTEVRYYIDYVIREVKEQDIETELSDAIKRANECYNKINK